MNNGVTTNNNQNNTAEQPVLTPMAGVKIAPASDAPTNASTQTSAVTTAANTQTPGASLQNNVSPTPTAVSPATAPVQTMPQLTNPTPTPTPVTPQPTTQTQQQSNIKPASTEIQPPRKKKKSIVPLLFFIIIGLIVYIVYMTKTYQNQIDQLDYNCTPVTSSKKEVELDLNSTLVKDLYKKVFTNIREDIAQPEFNDNMKLYLAYRQIIELDKNESNCNGFSLTSMEPYTCEESTNFTPKAFTEDTLKQEIKKLYGEKATIPMANIQLGSSCIVGYQYIPERHEFVQGTCGQQNATSFKVDKKLTKAVSTKNTIILTEEVQYHANEKMPLPETLKNGTYYYTFRLDMNYNYVLISKTYESKY